jgi:hypothetical protein
VPLGQVFLRELLLFLENYYSSNAPSSRLSFQDDKMDPPP